MNSRSAGSSRHRQVVFPSFLPFFTPCCSLFWIFEYNTRLPDDQELLEIPQGNVKIKSKLVASEGFIRQ
jgi:hypothetical protein